MGSTGRGASLYHTIYVAVRRIPRGRVASYGQLAEQAGLPGQARLVGYALHRLPDDTDVPWHRVVNARGGSSLDERWGADRRQRALLEEEGVVFRADGRLDLERYRAESRPQALAS